MACLQILGGEGLYTDMVDKMEPSVYSALALCIVECQRIDKNEFNRFPWLAQKFSGCLNHTNESLD